MKDLYFRQPTRRAILKTAAVIPWLAAPGHAQKRSARAYVGCYTTAERKARGDGIHVYETDLDTGAWSHLQRLGELVNPSFLVLSRDQRFLYSAHGDERYASSFAIDKSTGFLTPLNQAQTGGVNGAHAALDPGGKFLLVANYGSGTVAVLPVRPDGALAGQIQLVTLTGPPGPHRTEQTSSHPHQIVFDPSGRFVVIPDKGLDRIFIFRFDPASGKLSPAEPGYIAARAGHAPRHFAFHPRLPIAWALNELGNSTTAYQWDAQRGALRPIQILPSLPSDYTGANTAAEIAVPDTGAFVYCSNRGHDSIAIFGVDPQAGLLKSVGWVSTQGKSPRFITLDPSGRFLYAANEQSDTIVTFRVNPSTGALTPTGQIVRNASPVAIVFASA